MMGLLVSSLLACRAPGPGVVSAEEVGVVGQNDTIQGRDGGGSAMVFGRSVWTYGDTVLNVEDEWGRTWHHNSVSFTDDVDAGDGVGGFEEPVDAAGAPRHLIPPTTSEQAFNDAHWGDDCRAEPCGARWAVWPGTPVWDSDRERALILYGLVYAEPGDMNFAGMGESIAEWTDPDRDPVRPVVDPDAEHPDALWGPGEDEPGVTANIVDDRLVSFACPQEGIDRPCRLASAPLDHIWDATAWQWWDGSAWGPRDKAKTLFEGAPIMAVTWNAYLDAWLVVYSPPIAGAIYARTAPEITGPWSEAVKLYTVAGDAPYDAQQHPELEEQDGKVQYVTYSRATGDSWFGSEFPLVRIELE
jgi:hypothetical protein